VSAIYLSGNPFQHQRTKHIEMDIHFVREKVARGEVRVLHVPSRYQIADIFTKGLLRVLFNYFRDNLSIREPPASTEGECQNIFSIYSLIICIYLYLASQYSLPYFQPLAS